MTKTEAAEKYSSQERESRSQTVSIRKIEIKAFEAGWDQALDLVLQKVPMTDGARSLVREMRDGAFTPQIPGN